MDVAQPQPMHRDGALVDLLRSVIAQEGPISVERYMALALGHPVHGYYMTRDPLGAAGDFTTAPEISQMFGELLGVWSAAVWQGMGRPAPVRLVELGPGRGTLAADLLRAARGLPAFRSAIDLHLVETSGVLQQAQQRTLAAQDASATWHRGIETVPEAPAIVIANEFFDALPIRQYVRGELGWCERLVGLDAAGELAFGLAREASFPLLREATAGSLRRDDGAPNRHSGGRSSDVFEFCPGAQAIVQSLADRFTRHGGALLAIDYGHAQSGVGDTLQAVMRHRSVDVLADPGEADLTAHVDFAALARAATRAGAAVHGPVTQGAFLQSLGLAQRATALKRKATAAQSDAIDAAVARLSGPAPGMGDLFKVMAVTHPELPAPPGFAPEFDP